VEISVTHIQEVKSLYKFKELLFVMEKKFDFCAVRKDFENIN